MSSGPGGWLPLVLTTFGGGVVGSAITTYGAQGRARRKARSRAMIALEHIEATRLARTVGEAFAYDRQAFAELEARCMMAGVPRQPVYWYKALSEGAAGKDMDLGPIVASVRLIGYPGQLIYQALWHPYLSKLRRPFQLRRLQRTISRASKIHQMEWLESVHDERDLTQLSRVSSWVLSVTQLDGQSPTARQERSE
jgi:hypothetical protein